MFHLPAPCNFQKEKIKGTQQKYILFFIFLPPKNSNEDIALKNIDSLAKNDFRSFFAILSLILYFREYQKTNILQKRLSRCYRTNFYLFFRNSSSEKKENSEELLQKYYNDSSIKVEYKFYKNNPLKNRWCLNTFKDGLLKYLFFCK